MQPMQTPAKIINTVSQISNDLASEVAKVIIGKEETSEG